MATQGPSVPGERCGTRQIVKREYRGQGRWVRNTGSEHDEQVIEVRNTARCSAPLSGV
ncbi:hypothetical protein RSAG8_09619, partial [Rhizoctonia solani AG-8 WAC10335]